MYSYANKLPIRVEIEKPDSIFFEILHSRIGTYRGLSQIAQLMKCTFMIRDQHVKDTFSMIAAREMTNMEILGELMQLLRGIDASFVDCIDLNYPVYEVVQNWSGGESVHEKTVEDHGIADDLCAMIMHQQQLDDALMKDYQEIIEKTDDQGVIAVLEWLISGKETNLSQWGQLMHRITYPIKHKDFGEGYLSEQGGELDNGNYFDPPVPYFLNPDDFDEQDYIKENESEHY